MGAVMTAFLFHLRRLPEQAAKVSPVARILGKIGVLSCIVVIQGVVIMLMTLFALNLHVYNLGAYLITLTLTYIDLPDDHRGAYTCFSVIPAKQLL